MFVSGNGGVNLVVDQSAAFVRQQRIGAGFFRVLGVPRDCRSAADAAPWFDS